MWRKKCHSFLKLCKFWETSIRISPIVYQHKIFVLGASRGFEAPIIRSFDLCVRVLAGYKRFINRRRKLSRLIVKSLNSKKIHFRTPPPDRLNPVVTIPLANLFKNLSFRLMSIHRLYSTGYEGFKIWE